MCKTITKQLVIVLIINFYTFRDYESNGSEAFVYYKLDCIYFELHRRLFVNCLVQLKAFHKVNTWLKKVTPQIRCECCRPDYYEYMLDCERVLRSQLVLTGMHQEIVKTRALSGGRCFFMKTKPCQECELRSSEENSITHKEDLDEMSAEAEKFKLEHEESEPEYETVELMFREDSTSTASAPYAPAIPPRNASEEEPVKRSKFQSLRDSIVLATYRGVALSLGPFPQAQHAVLRRIREREQKSKHTTSETDRKSTPSSEAVYEIIDNPPQPEDVLEKLIREKRFWTINVMQERAEAAEAEAKKKLESKNEEE